MDLVDIAVRKSLRLPGQGIVRFRTARYATPDTPRMFAEDVGYNRTSARLRGKEVGFLQTEERARDVPWMPGRVDRGEVRYIKVAPEHKRKGIATGMVRRARDAGLDPKRSPILSVEGRAFQDSFGKAQPAVGRALVDIAKASWAGSKRKDAA